MIVLKEKDYGKFSELLGKARKGIKNIGTKFGKKAEEKPVMTINGSRPSSLTYNLPGSSKSVVSSVQPTRSSVITPASQSKQVNVVSSSVAKKSPKKQYDPSRKKKRGYARKQRQAQRQAQQAANNPAPKSVMTNNPGAVTSPNSVTANPPAKGMTRFQKETLARQGQPKPQIPQGKLMILGDKGPAINPRDLENGSGSVLKNNETIQFNKTDVPEGSVMPTAHRGGIREQQRLRQEAMARMNANPQKYQGLQYHTEAGGYQYVPNLGLQNRGVVPKKPQTIVFTPKDGNVVANYGKGSVMSSSPVANTKQVVSTAAKEPQTIVFTPEQGNVTTNYGKGSVMSNPKPEQPKAPKSSPKAPKESPKQPQTPKGKGKGTQTTKETTQQTTNQQTQQTSNQQQGNQETPGYWQRGKEWWGRRSGLEKAGIIGGATAVPFAGYNIYRNSNND